MIGSLYTFSSARGVAVVGNYAYVADNRYSEGLKIIDISLLSSPRLVGICYISGYAEKVVVVGNYLRGGLFSRIIVHAGSASDVAVVGNYTYVANENAPGLKIVDISNTSSPSLTGTLDTLDSARGVAVVGNYAYVAGRSAGLKIIDISNPVNPSLTGTLDIMRLSIEKIVVVGNYAYVTYYSTSEIFDTGLQIIDISNPESPSLVGTYETSCNEPIGQIKVIGSYVADSYAGLKIIDISNPVSPSLAGTLEIGFVRGVAVVGNYDIFVTNGDESLQIIRVGGIHLSGVSSISDVGH